MKRRDYEKLEDDIADLEHRLRGILERSEPEKYDMAMGKFKELKDLLHSFVHDPVDDFGPEITEKLKNIYLVNILKSRNAKIGYCSCFCFETLYDAIRYHMANIEGYGRNWDWAVGASQEEVDTINGILRDLGVYDRFHLEK